MPEQEKPVEQKDDQKKSNSVRKAITKIADIGSAVGAAAGLVKNLLKIFNNREIYTGMGSVTPAANPNRPMNPAFNAEFSKNGTTGIPRLADVYTKWTEYGDSYATQLAAEDIFDKLVAVYHYNRPYTADTIKRFLVDGTAISFGLTQLLRDASWVRFPDQDIIEFATLYRKRSIVKDDGVGLVDLYIPDHLAPSNFPQTLDDLVPIMNDASKVILPNNILEFINHYYGNLFVVDADDFNDQVVRMIMTEIDWFDLSTDELTTTDVNEWTLEYFANTLRAFIKKYNTLIADINAATLMSNVLQRLSYLWDQDNGQPKRSTMVFDKTFEQALINAYTSDTSKFLSELFKNEYIRLDFIPQVEDELTTFMFLGGAISYASSETEYKVAKPVTVRCEVLKFDSNPEVAWPSSIQSGASDIVITIEDQFGYMITSNPYVVSTTGYVQISTSYDEETGVVGTVTTEELAPMKAKLLEKNIQGVGFRCEAKSSISFGSKSQILTAGWKAYMFVYHGCNLSLREQEAASMFSDQLCSVTVLKGSLVDGVTTWTELGQLLINVQGVSGAPNFAKLVNNKTVLLSETDMTIAQVATYITTNYAGLSTLSYNGSAFLTAEGTPYVISGYKFYTWCSISIPSNIKPKAISVGMLFTAAYEGKYVMLSNLVYGANSGLAQPVTSLLSALSAYVAYSEAVSVDFDSYENLTVGTSGGSAPNFIVGLSACHLPIIVHYVSFNPNDGSEITAVGTPELVKANYIPLFFSLTDIKAIMYKMIGSLFKVSKRELKEK